MKKFILDILKGVIQGLINHWILTLGLAFLPGMLLFFSPVIKQIIEWKWSGWVLSGFIILIFLIGFVHNKYFDKGKRIKNWYSDPPKYNASYDNSTFDREYAGVMWKVIAGTHVDPLHSKLVSHMVRAWIYPNPRCPKCGYELLRYRNNWQCVACEMNYLIPKKLRDGTWEKVRRVFDTYVVQWGYNNFGIANEPHKPLHVFLKELKEQKDKQNRK